MIYNIFDNKTIIKGFPFTSLTFPANIHDAIIVKCENRSDCFSPRYDVPYHTIEEYIKFINEHKLEKAVIILDEISFIEKCPTLKHLSIHPSVQANGNFDFSPLYNSNVIDLTVTNPYGMNNQYVSEIDISKLAQLVSLGVSYNEKTYNLNKATKLKSLFISNYKSKSGTIEELFTENEIDTLTMISCGMKSLKGIEKANALQCLYLYYNRSLCDIKDLCAHKSTLRALRIENCPKINDFSVLQELESLELLQLNGGNTLPDLEFIKKLKTLKTFTFSMNVQSGDLSPCLGLSYAYCSKRKSHYNIKDKDLPKKEYFRGNDNIEIWRRQE